MMEINESLLMEYRKESENTRKLLAAVPFDNPGWKPHAKSMSVSELAIHIADLANWVVSTIERDGLDFATEPPRPRNFNSTQELLDFFDASVAAAEKSLANTNKEKLMQNWTLRNGDKVYFTMPKVATLRFFAFSHVYHHRGQLTVYLRLLDIPVPGMYGPTADEKVM